MAYKFIGDNAAGFPINAGSAADRPAIGHQDAAPGYEYWETDGSKSQYTSDGSNWNAGRIGGAAIIIPVQGSMPQEQRYELANQTGAASITCTATDISHIGTLYVTLIGKAPTSENVTFSGKIGAALDKSVGVIPPTRVLDGTSDTVSPYDVPATGVSVTYVFEKVCLGSFTVTKNAGLVDWECIITGTPRT